jgi:hypothetical protein
MLVMKLAFLVSGLMMIGVAIRVPAHAQQTVGPAFEWAITVLAIADDVLGLYGRRFFGWIARRAPLLEAGASPLSRWMTANVFSLAFMESCILFGIFLHFVGARPWSAKLLFGVGIVSLLLWGPGTPPSAAAGMQTRG